MERKGKLPGLKPNPVNTPVFPKRHLQYIHSKQQHKYAQNTVVRMGSLRGNYNFVIRASSDTNTILEVRDGIVRLGFLFHLVGC